MSKKKILLLSDDLRMHSGIATMSRELVLGTVKQYDWVQIAGAIQHPDKGKVINMDVATAQQTGVPDAKVTLYPVDGYGNEEVLYQVIDREKPDAIMHFTDPRFWGWLYAMERQLRRKYPIVYYNIWDDLAFPMYNRAYYESCDLLMSISKQTFNINKWVLNPKNCFTINGEFDKNGNLIPNQTFLKDIINKGIESVKNIPQSIENFDVICKKFVSYISNQLDGKTSIDGTIMTYDRIYNHMIKFFDIEKFKNFTVFEKPSGNNEYLTDTAMVCFPIAGSASQIKIMNNI